MPNDAASDGALRCAVLGRDIGPERDPVMRQWGDLLRGMPARG